MKPVRYFLTSAFLKPYFVEKVVVLAGVTVEVNHKRCSKLKSGGHASHTGPRTSIASGRVGPAGGAGAAAYPAGAGGAGAAGAGGAGSA